jgi:hypothetical protein
LCSRGHALFHDGQWFHVYCFKEPADAQKFLDRFGGEKFDPTERGRGQLGKMEEAVACHALKLGDVAAHRVKIRLRPRDDGITTLAPQTCSNRARQIKFGPRVWDEKLDG